MLVKLYVLLAFGSFFLFLELSWKRLPSEKVSVSVTFFSADDSSELKLSLLSKS